MLVPRRVPILNFLGGTITCLTAHFWIKYRSTEFFKSGTEGEAAERRQELAGVSISGTLGGGFGDRRCVCGGMDSCSVHNMNFHRVHSTQWGKNYSCNMFIIPWILHQQKTLDADAFLCVWTIQDPKIMSIWCQIFHVLRYLFGTSARNASKAWSNKLRQKQNMEETQHPWSQAPGFGWFRRTTLVTPACGTNPSVGQGPVNGCLGMGGSFF